MRKRLLGFLCVSILLSFLVSGYTVFPHKAKKSGDLYLRSAGTLTVVLESKVPFFDRVEYTVNGEKGEFTPYDNIGAKQSFRISRTNKPIHYTFSMKGNEQIEMYYKPFYVQFIMLRHTVNVNGFDTQIDVAPFFEKDEEMLPIRFVTEFLGANVEWSNDRRKVTVQFLGRETVLYVGSRTAYFNGRKIKITTAPIIVHDRTFLPISVVKELFNLTVKNDRDVGIITIGK